MSRQTTLPMPIADNNGSGCHDRTRSKKRGLLTDQRAGDGTRANHHKMVFANHRTDRVVRSPLRAREPQEHHRTARLTAETASGQEGLSARAPPESEQSNSEVVLRGINTFPLRLQRFPCSRSREFLPQTRSFLSKQVRAAPVERGFPCIVPLYQRMDHVPN